MSFSTLWDIRKRLWAINIALIITVLLLTGLFTHTRSLISELNEHHHKNDDFTGHVLQININLMQARLAEKNFQIHHDAKYIEEYKTSITQLQRQLANLKKDFVEQIDLQNVEQLESALESYRQLFMTIAHQQPGVLVASDPSIDDKNALLRQTIKSVDLCPLRGYCILCYTAVYTRLHNHH
ncbi:MAG: hypothetical protein FD130_2154 [Halothiobacillaceae bacterium]|nr:MAG: hypothetical protein FD130_2154 [Halothiobacillaceae bacterium]